MARPSLYKPEYCELLIKHMERGLSFKAFAGVIGVCRRTITTWAKIHPDFKEAKAIAEAKALLFWEELLIKTVLGKVRGAPAAVLIYTMKARFQMWDQPKKEPEEKSPAQAQQQAALSITEDGLISLIKKAREIK